MALMDRSEQMEALVSQIQALSGNPEDWAHLHGVLRSSDDLLQRNVERLPEVLAVLDPARHSLAWMYILDVQVNGTTQSESRISSIVCFLNVCSPGQIRLAPDKFTSLCRKLKDQVMAIQDPGRAILPLKIAIRKLQPSTEHLTPQHADFALVCLLSKCYNAALPVLEDDIFKVDAKKTSLTPREFLLYCYYGGMLFIGLKRFQKAAEFLHHAVTAPSNALNAITVAAYKKFQLVSLISQGQVPTFSKYTPPVVQRNLKTCCQDYAELALCYSKRNIEDLKRCIDSHADSFKADNNLGLAQQVIASLYKRNIQRLTQTYLTLSLQDIADTVHLQGPKEAEMHVLQMIEDGEIFATINQKDGMVRFHEDPEQYNTLEMSARLDAETQSMILLHQKLATMDEQISCDRGYLNKMNHKERHSRFGDADDFDVGPQKMFESM